MCKETGKRKPGRPQSQRINHLQSESPEEIARAMFAYAKPPDPSKRKKGK